MARLRIILLVLFAALLQIVVAQPATLEYETLDSLACKADTIVIGRLEKVHVAGDHLEFQVGVESTLKGKATPTVVLSSHYFIDRAMFEQCIASHARLLWFKGAAITNGWTSIYLGSELPKETYNAGWRRLPVFTMDLEVLTTEKQAIDYLKSISTTTSVATDYVRVRTPRYLLSSAGYVRSGGIDLVLPVVPRLEAVAKDMILFPGRFLHARSKIQTKPYVIDRVDRDSLRKTGVQFLQFFKTAENEGLLKSLLGDKTVYTFTFAAPGKEPTTVREYSIRLMAYKVLSQWGVTVAKPVTTAEPTEEVSTKLRDFWDRRELRIGLPTGGAIDRTLRVRFTLNPESDYRCENCPT